MVPREEVNTEPQEEKNISLGFAFMQSVLDDSAVLDEIPNHATIVFLPEDDPEQVEANLELALRSARSGKNVYIRHVRALSLA